LEVGGAERSLLEILPRLRGTECVMCHVYVGDSLRAAYEEAGIGVISLDLPDKYGFAKAVSKVREIASGLKPDLLHTTLFRSDVVGRWVGSRLDVPVISSFVNDSYAPARWRRLGPTGRLKLLLVRSLDAWTARWASYFVAISESVKEANARALGIPRDKITVIYRGREPQQFAAPPSSVIAGLRASLGLIPEVPVLLNVARLIERKGQADLIQAMSAVLEVVPNARLLIAGDGAYRRTLENLISELGLSESVQLLGTREDIPHLLHLADCFVFPSHYEGHGGALVEAMMAGCPIVAADTPVHREAVTHQESGLLVPVGDSAAIAEGILRLLQRPTGAKEMGERARRVAMERFHIDHIAAQHEALYERVLREWRAGR
jgi:glycosyltransferase involved in cell wall biosynthesis